MVGKPNPDEDAPVHDNDGESTVVATTAPDIAGVPLPISSPPPGPTPAAGAPPPAARPAPAGAPGRPPGAPFTAPGLPSGRTASTPRAPGVAGALNVPPSNRAPGAPARPPGVTAGKMTHVGLGPPGVPLAPNRAPGVPGSQRSPLAPSGPAGVKPPAVSPPKPASARSPMAPAVTSTAKSPGAPAPKPAEPAVPKLHSEDDEPPDDGPTMAAEIGGFAEMRERYDDPPPRTPPSPAAVIGGRSSGTSPLASTAYTPSSGPESSEENEAATAAIPKDVLDRVRANPKAILEEELRAKNPPPAAGAPPRLYEDELAAEETKAVAREDLMRKQDAHVVVGADASGDEATLAVPPSANEAAVHANIASAIGASLQGRPPDGAFPPPPGYPGGPSPVQQTMPSMGQGGAPYPGAHEPGGPMAMPPMGQQQPWSSGQMSAAPRVAGGAGSYPGGPMMQAPGPAPRSQAQAPTNWQPLQAPRSRSKISGQMILLFVVGFVCLAIFVTGIVLFVTTKF